MGVKDEEIGVKGRGCGLVKMYDGEGEMGVEGKDGCRLGYEGKR